MPFRRRRNFRKRGYRRYKRSGYGKRAVKRTLNKFRSQGMSFFKLRTNPVLSSDAFGDISYSFSLTNPNSTTAANSAGYSNAVQDWSSLTALYDSYRVFGVKIKFTPDLPNNLSATTTYKAIYSYVDYDSPTPVTTYNSVSEYENLKTYNLYRPFSRYVKVPKILNTGVASSVVTFGWMDIANPQPSGHVGFFVDAASLSTDWGQLTVTYYVGCKNRR